MITQLSQSWLDSGLLRDRQAAAWRPLGGMKGQPPSDKQDKIPDWGHVDGYELSA